MLSVNCSHCDARMSRVFTRRQSRDILYSNWSICHASSTTALDFQSFASKIRCFPGTITSWRIGECVDLLSPRGFGHLRSKFCRKPRCRRASRRRQRRCRPRLSERALYALVFARRVWRCQFRRLCSLSVAQRVHGMHRFRFVFIYSPSLIPWPLITLPIFS